MREPEFSGLCGEQCRYGLHPHGTRKLEQVFEKFRRMEEASDRGKGAGLGLAIAKGFVEAMDGRIAAASPIHNGLGTRILISLKKETATPRYLL